MDRRLGLFTAAALYVLCAGAEAQELSRFAGTAATNYALDGMGTVSRAYGLRRLLTSYSTNKLINIRRASDNATTDIGFTATGAIDIATATTFCNATTCSVVTWYDQSGAGGNLVQATAGNQPALIFTCLGSYPCIQSTAGTMTLTSASNYTPATGLATISAVGLRVTGGGVCTFLREDGTSGNQLRGGNAGFWRLQGSAGTLEATAADSTWHAGIGIANGASSTLTIDGVNATGSITNGTAAGAPAFTGVASSTCQVTEAAFWDNVALSATIRTMLNANQRAWWGF